MAAIKGVLKDYGHITVKQAMAKYAPAGDGANDPDAYARSVARRMKVTIDTYIDTLSASQLDTFAEAIKTVEGWIVGTAFKRKDPKIPEEIRRRL